MTREQLRAMRANGGKYFHLVRDDGVAVCGYRPSSPRGRWADKLKEGFSPALYGPGRKCLKCYNALRGS